MTVRECSGQFELLADAYGLKDAFWSINYQCLVLDRVSGAKPREKFTIHFFPGSNAEDITEVGESLEAAFILVNPRINSLGIGKPATKPDHEFATL